MVKREVELSVLSSFSGDHEFAKLNSLAADPLASKINKVLENMS